MKAPALVQRSLGPTEWLLMRCIWEHGPSTPNQMTEHLIRHGRHFQPGTTSVLLARLEDKGYVEATIARPSQGATRGRPSHVYSALVTYEAALKRTIQNFLEAFDLDAESVNEALAQFIIEPRQTRKKSG